MTADAPAPRWAPTRPEDLKEILKDFDAPWWVAGGWALDLYLGRQTREHSDLEIGCFRQDLTQLISALPHWEFHAALNKKLRPLSVRDSLAAEEFALWAKPQGDPLWALEVLAETEQDGIWHYRRQADITRPAASLLGTSEMGIKFIQPEIQLLYKAKDPRPKDIEDLKTVAPLLDDEARQWLMNAIQHCHPTSPFQQALASM